MQHAKAQHLFCFFLFFFFWKWKWSQACWTMHTSACLLCRDWFHWRDISDSVRWSSFKDVQCITDVMICFVFQKTRTLQPYYSGVTIQNHFSGTFTQRAVKMKFILRLMCFFCFCFIQCQASPLWLSHPLKLSEEKNIGSHPFLVCFSAVYWKWKAASLVLLPSDINALLYKNHTTSHTQHLCGHGCLCSLC